MLLLLIACFSTFVCGYVWGKLSVKKRKAAEISIKLNAQNGDFVFTAYSTSEPRIWIKSMVVSNYNVNIEVFGNTIFEHKKKKSERVKIPADFVFDSAGTLRISDIDARIQLNSGWQQCISMIRSEESGIIIIEFVPNLEQK